MSTITTPKYPEDFEMVIYNSMLQMCDENKPVTIGEVIECVKKRVKQKIDPESVFIFVQRMCQEGMVERVSKFEYKPIEFDPNFSLD